MAKEKNNNKQYSGRVERERPAPFPPFLSSLNAATACVYPVRVSVCGCVCSSSGAMVSFGPSVLHHKSDELDAPVSFRAPSFSLTQLCACVPIGARCLFFFISFTTHSLFQNK